MSNPRAKLIAKIAALTTEQIEAALVVINKRWNEYKQEERMVRAYMVDEFQARMGEDATDAILDKLEAMAA